MRILLFKGRSFISRLIRFQTRSEYSHVAIDLSDDFSLVYEAWHKGGVLKHDSYKKLCVFHRERTVVDVYQLSVSLSLSDLDTATLKDILDARVGQKYDFRSVFRFVSRRSAHENNKWFCSELVMDVLRDIGIPLLNLSPSEASPRDVSISPNLKLSRTITLEYEFA